MSEQSCLVRSAAPGNLDPQNSKELFLKLAGMHQHIFLQFFHRDNIEVIFQLNKLSLMAAKISLSAMKSACNQKQLSRQRYLEALRYPPLRPFSQER